MSGIEALEERRKALLRELRQCEDDLSEAYLHEMGAPPVGAVIKSRGRVMRVTERRASSGTGATYRGPRLKKDGSEGAEFEIYTFDDIEVLDLEYDERRNYAQPPPSSEPRTPTELAAGILAHLQRWEAEGTPGVKVFEPGAWQGGSRVGVRYLGYQGSSTLTRDEAGRYLDWLDAGNVGTHHQALREQ